MQFSKKTKNSKIAIAFGFVMSYIIFTVILFTILFFLEKIPPSWSIFQVSVITLTITIAGILIKRLLK